MNLSDIEKIGQDIADALKFDCKEKDKIEVRFSYPVVSMSFDKVFAVDSSTNIVEIGTEKIVLFRGCVLEVVNGEIKIDKTEIKSTIFNPKNSKENFLALLGKEHRFDIYRAEELQSLVQELWEIDTIINIIKREKGKILVVKDGFMASAIGAFWEEAKKEIWENLSEGSVILGVAKKSKIVEYLYYNNKLPNLEKEIGIWKIPDGLVRDIYSHQNIENLFLIKTNDVYNFYTVNVFPEKKEEEILGIFNFILKDSLTSYPNCLFYAHKECVINEKLKKMITNTILHKIFEKNGEEGQAVFYDLHKLMRGGG